MRIDRIIRLGSLIFIMAGASAVYSVSYNDPGTGFSIDLQPEGGSVCYLKPSKMRVDSACEGLKVADAERTIPVNVLLTAIIRFQGWRYVAEVTWQPKPGAGPMTTEDAKDLTDGVSGGNPHLRLENPDPDLLIINDLQVLRYTMLSSDQASPRFGASVNYLVVGKEALLTVAFLTDEAHLSQVRSDAEKAMVSIKMPSATLPARWKPRAYYVGNHLGAMLVNLAVFATICAGAVVLVRRFRRRTPRPTL